MVVIFVPARAFLEDFSITVVDRYTFPVIIFESHQLDISMAIFNINFKRHSPTLFGTTVKILSTVVDQGIVVEMLILIMITTAVGY